MAHAKWTVEQEAAISERGRLLVAAAAGSGKTAVLVERLLRQITDPLYPVDVERFLVVTFTKAAAQEMRERIRYTLEQALLNEPDVDQAELLLRQLNRLSQTDITTLHSFCLDLLRRYFYVIGLDPSFRVADEEEAELLRFDVLEEVLERNYELDDPAFINLIEGFSSDRDDYPLKVEILRLYEFANSHANPEEWLDRLPKTYTWDDEESMLKSPWGESVRESITDRLNTSVILLKQAESLANKQDGPAIYLKVLRDDLYQLNHINESLGSGQWIEAWQELQSVQFEKLPSYRTGKNALAESPLREQVKNLRDEAKKNFSKLKEDCSWDINGHLSKLRTSGLLIDSMVKLVKEFSETFAKAKLQRNIVDFSDLEHFTLRLFLSEGGAEIAKQLQEYYCEVLVDEYQDINSVQENILNWVSRSDGNLFMVGDVKQSIYRFRMADPTLFLSKYTVFSHWTPERNKMYTENTGLVIDLARNFRSRQTVIHGVNYLFQQIMTEGAGEIRYDENASLIYGANYAEGFSGFKTAEGPIEVHLLELKKELARSGSLSNSSENEEQVSNNPVQANNTLGIGDNIEQEQGQDQVGLVEFDEEEREAMRQEASLVAERIQTMIPGTGDQAEFQVFDTLLKTYRPVRYSDIVILMRAHSMIAPLFVEEFQKSGIPVFAETSNGYFTTGEVDTVISLLKIIDNPRQDIPLAAVLRSVLVGLDGSALGKIRALIPDGDYYYEPLTLVAWAWFKTEKFIRSPENSSENWWLTSLNEIENVLFLNRQTWSELLAEAEKLPMDLKEKVGSFWRLLQKWRDFSRRNSLAELIGVIYEDTSYLAYCGTLPNGNQRQGNLRLLYEKALRFEEIHYRGLFRFLRFLERFRGQGKDYGQARSLGENENVVRIMTVHASKGLEFPVVFVVGLGRNFNLRGLSGKLLIHSKLGVGIPNIDVENKVRYPSLVYSAVKQQLLRETLAEELRILYVALTRAKEKLLLYGSSRNLNKLIERWHFAGSWDDMTFPDSHLRSARKYLDWIGPALTRHVSNVFKVDGSREGFFEDSSNWEVFIHSQNENCTNGKLTGDKAEMLEDNVVDSQESQKDNSAMDNYWPEVERRLNWIYPYISQVGKKAKTSVSELKREHFDKLTGENPENYLTFQPGRPKFLQNNRELSATERGTALHTAMEHLPLKDLASLINSSQVKESNQLNDLLQDYVFSLLERGIIDSKQLEYISIPLLERFINSTLGQRMLNAKHVWREVPFTLALPHKEHELPQLIQGVIDVILFGDKEDEVEVIDYKTDVLPESTGEGILRERYGIQLAYYSYAVESLLKIKVSRVTLYSVFLGCEINLEPLWLKQQITDCF